MEAYCELLRFNMMESASITDQDQKISRLNQIKKEIEKAMHQLSLSTTSITGESLLKRKRDLDAWLQKLMTIANQDIKVSLSTMLREAI